MQLVSQWRESLEGVEFTWVSVIYRVRVVDPKCNSMHIMSRVTVSEWRAAALKRLPDAGFRGKRDPQVNPTAQSYFPLSRSLAMVANCMLDVPS